MSPENNHYWVHAKGPIPCGGSCGTQLIRKGDPMLVVVIGGTKRVRCRDCAQAMYGEDPPERIEEPESMPVVLAGPRKPDFVLPRSLGAAVRQDVRARQIAREPGDED